MLFYRHFSDLSSLSLLPCLLEDLMPFCPSPSRHPHPPLRTGVGLPHLSLFRCIFLHTCFPTQASAWTSPPLLPLTTSYFLFPALSLISPLPDLVLSSKTLIDSGEFFFRGLTWLLEWPSFWFLVFLVRPTSLVAQMVKCLPTVWETWVQSLGWEDLLEREMGTHSSILAWKIPWTEELVGYSP